MCGEKSTKSFVETERFSNPKLLTKLAGDEEVEPSSQGSEPSVIPLYQSPINQNPHSSRNAFRSTLRRSRRSRTFFFAIALRNSRGAFPVGVFSLRPNVYGVINQHSQSQNCLTSKKSWRLASSPVKIRRLASSFSLSSSSCSFDVICSMASMFINWWSQRESNPYLFSASELTYR